MEATDRLARVLWGTFVVLFAVIAVASVLPVRPIVLVFPAWGLVVLGAILGSIATALGAAAIGWPPAAADGEVSGS